MTPTPSAATFTEADRSVLIGIQVRLEYLVKGLEEQGGQIRELERDRAAKQDVHALCQRIDAVLIPRVELLEREKASREERSKESNIWLGGLGSVVRYGVIPAAMFIAGHLWR